MQLLICPFGDTPKPYEKGWRPLGTLGTHYSELFEAECLAERGRVTPMGDGRPRPGSALTSRGGIRREAWQLQGKLVAARKSALISSDIFLLLEHAPVFTLGRRGDGKTSRFRKSPEHSGMPLFQVERGGQHYSSRSGSGGGIRHRGSSGSRTQRGKAWSTM